MGRLVEPEDPVAVEVKAHSGVKEDGPVGLAWDIFGKELRELLFLYPNILPDARPVRPDTEVNLRQLDLFMKNYPFRVVELDDETLGTFNLHILTYDLTAKVEIDILLMEDEQAILLEDGTYHLLEVQSV